MTCNVLGRVSARLPAPPDRTERRRVAGAGLQVFALGLCLLLAAPALAEAQERVGDGVLGALAGALVGGPVGAVVGAGIGYGAGPEISNGFRGRHRHYRRVRHRRR